MTSLCLQNVVSVDCHGDVIGSNLRIMISEKEVGFFRESPTPFQVRRTSVCSLEACIGLRTEQEKELQEALPHGAVDQPMLCWPEGLDFVMDYHTMINSSTLLMYTHCLKGLKNVKFALIPIIPRELGRDGA